MKMWASDIKILWRSPRWPRRPSATRPPL